MSDLFESKNVAPMLATEVSKPFDSADHLFELKFDGMRAIAYLGRETVLKNRRGQTVTARFPELADLCRCVKERAILDGEIVSLTAGRPDFFALQRRNFMRDEKKIAAAAQRAPVQFVAFDVLYLGKDVTSLPLEARKQLLDRRVGEGCGLSRIRYIEGAGRRFFELVARENLEGIVAKDRKGLYHVGKRTRDWLKIKALKEEDLTVFGYLPADDGLPKVLLVGEEKEGAAMFRGKVSLAPPAARARLHAFSKQNTLAEPAFEGFPDAVWLPPVLKVRVTYLQKTGSGSMRQPVFKGFCDEL